MRDIQDILKSIASKAKSTIELTSQVVKEKLDTNLNRQSLSPVELATFITKHDETEIERKEFLGFQYNFYKLEIDDISFYLETKGHNSDYILELTVNTPTQTLYEYHSFDRNQNQNDKIHIPNAIHEIVN